MALLGIDLRIRSEYLSFYFVYQYFRLQIYLLPVPMESYVKKPCPIIMYRYHSYVVCNTGEYGRPCLRSGMGSVGSQVCMGDVVD